MKALISREVGGPEALTLENLPDPEARPGHVVVDVKACGVNYPDSHRRGPARARCGSRSAPAASISPTR
jgi:NADPH:quinone reductase-like Zn-dependent oxidoreductase